MTSNDAKIGELIDISDRLSEVMSREVELLRDLRTSEIEPLQEQKATLASAYATALDTVRKNPSLVHKAGPELRNALKNATEELRATLGDNLRVVHAVKTVNERLIKTLSEAVAEQRSAGTTYTATGATTPTTPATGAVPVAVDHRI